MAEKYTLKVRGNNVSVGTREDCMNELFRRWGWVPMRIFEQVVRPELVPVAVKARG